MGSVFKLKIPGGGGVSEGEGGGGEPGRCLRRISGRGLDLFFCAEIPTSKSVSKLRSFSQKIEHAQVETRSLKR